MIVRQLTWDEKRDCEIAYVPGVTNWGGGCRHNPDRRAFGRNGPLIPCARRPQWMVDGTKLCTQHMKVLTYDSVFVETGRFRSVVIVPYEAHAVDLSRLGASR